MRIEELYTYSVLAAVVIAMASSVAVDMWERWQQLTAIFG